MRKRIVDYTDAELDRVVDLNLKGTFRLTRSFGALMAGAGRGSMIGFTSIRSQTTEPGQGAYAATKAATVMLFKTLAAELGPQGVRANTIAPGVVETPLTQQIKDRPEWYDAYADKAILKRWAQPSEMVGRRGVPRLRCVVVRDRHHAVRRRRLDRRRRPLQPAVMLCRPPAGLADARSIGCAARRSPSAQRVRVAGVVLGAVLPLGA